MTVGVASRGVHGLDLGPVCAARRVGRSPHPLRRAGGIRGQGL